MLLKDREDIERVVAEAEQIERGHDPAKVAGSDGPAPGAPESGAGGVSPSASPSPASFAEIASLGLLILDGGFLLTFGPGSAMPEPLRGEAKHSLELICAKYLPALGSIGPEGALLGIVAIHGFNCAQRSWQTSVPSPESSANVAQENPHS